MSAKSEAPVSWRSRLFWLVTIWTASVVALAIAAMGFRLLMTLAGLTA